MKKFTAITVFLITSLLFSRFIFSQVSIDSKLTEALQNNAGLVEVIVTFKGNNPPSAEQINLLSSLGITSGITFNSLPIAGVLANAAQVEALSKSSMVRSLYLNHQLEYYNYNETALTGVDRLKSDKTITSLNKGMPVSGKGIGVLINDSGVDGTHNDLKYGTHLVQNVLGSTNLHAVDELLPVTYVEGVPNTDNNSGHGTHCAGTVGGTGAQSAGKYEGVAPGAHLLGYGSGAVLFVLDGIGGFDYAITHQSQYGIRVITNSWGSSGSFDPNDPVNVASKAAYDRGIVVLFAAGNSGPGEDTNTPYAAPWVITIAAGDKDGKLADFSSRGLKDQKYDFTYDGQVWHYENRPTVTAPGVDVISTRAIAPVPLLGDDTGIEPAYVAYYTTMSGTSMATPHAAGIVALMLEANPSLNPDEVKAILQRTATNMPGYESWEVGAGYINAYAAVDNSFRNAEFGSTVNAFKTFNSNAQFDNTIISFTVDYNPVAQLSATENKFNFSVPEGTTVLNARVDGVGILGETGNPINLILIDPNGVEYGSGISLLFAIEYERTVSVANPPAGDWVLEVRGLRGDPLNPTNGISLPENVEGYIKLSKALGFTGLNDISGNPAESSIKLAVSRHLVDGYPDGTFRPNDPLTRFDFAQYLVMGQAVRQFLPLDGSTSFNDITSSQKLIIESVTNRGAALRDRFHRQRGVMLRSGAGKFSPGASMVRYSLAYSLVQALGLEDSAVARNGKPVTINFNGETIAIDDANQIPSGFEGYVQVALNLNLINAYFTLEQGPFDLQPEIHASFKPLQIIRRAEFAVIITRTHNQWTAGTFAKQNGENEVDLKPLTYSLEQNFPNPFNPSTSINFAIPQDGLVTLEIYNAIGEKVITLINEVKTAGNYEVNFDAAGLSSGMYIYKLTAGNFVQTRKMTMLK